MTGKPPRYRLVLQPTPDKSDARGIVRLRRALKALWRSYGLRCVEAGEVRPEERPAKREPSTPEV